jgi:hypothetical protein
VPAEAGPLPHNQAANTAPAKHEIDEDSTQSRMAYLPIFEQKIEDPADPETQ